MVEKVTSTHFEAWGDSPIARSLGLMHVHSVTDNLGNPIRTYYLDSGSPRLGLQVLPNRAFDAAGAFMLPLSDLSAFIISLLNNSSHLPQRIYSDMFTRPADGLKSDSSASWHIASLGYSFHEGSTGRGEVACVRVDIQSQSGFAVYTNGDYQNREQRQTVNLIGRLTMDLHRLVYKPQRGGRTG